MLTPQLPHRVRTSIRKSLVVAGALAVLTVAAAVEPAEARSYPRLFQSGEQMGGGLDAFPKWLGALERSVADRQKPENCRKGSKINICHLDAWDDFVKGLRGKDRMTQIRAVHREMNRRAYIVDPVNWGLKDYWATPLQFFKRQGDCEDYAIAKFLSLRALGVPNEDMRVVVLMDTNLKLAHAVLVVYLGDKAYVLDNQISKVVRAETIRHYRPIYSINETNWWLHRPKG